LRTSSEPLVRINIVGLGRLTAERIRASLSRSPFHVSDSPEPMPEEEIDIYVAPADFAAELLSPAPARRVPESVVRVRPVSVPVIACGPAALMRSSFLSGCADFLREPWQPEELGLRALGVLQRMRKRFEFPWGSLSLQGTLLETPTGEVMLTFHESRILRALLMGRGGPVSRQALSYFLWGNPGPAGSRVVDVHVAAIRKKVSSAVPEAGRFIRAVRREGYVIP
jgi:DNA-binding winged helix-turn-helix (wHTH) protein